MKGKSRKFSPEHEMAWDRLQRTAAELIRAVEEGCVVLGKSAVADGKVFIFHKYGDYTMIEPYGRFGRVINTKGDEYVNGIMHDDVYKFADDMEEWLLD